MSHIMVRAIPLTIFFGLPGDRSAHSKRLKDEGKRLKDEVEP